MRKFGLHRVSIIIVTHNSLPALDDSLTSLRPGVGQLSFELIVADNGSDDGSVDCVKRHFPQARIIESTRNLGFARACNQAAWMATGEYLLFHNPDVRLDPGAVERMIEVFSGYPYAGAVAGRMRFPDGTFQATCRNFPTPGNLMFSRGSALSLLPGRRRGYTLGDCDRVTEVPAVAGTLMMVRRDLFVSMCGFDERFFMYMEDTDLCLRLSRRGLKNYFVPQAGGIHLWARGSRAGKIKRRRYHHTSVWKYSVKHFSKPVSLVILPVVLTANLVLTMFLPDRKEGEWV